MKLTANKSDSWIQCIQITTNAHVSYNNTFRLAFGNQFIYLKQKCCVKASKSCLKHYLIQLIFTEIYLKSI